MARRYFKVSVLELNERGQVMTCHLSHNQVPGSMQIAPDMTVHEHVAQALREAFGLSTLNRVFREGADPIDPAEPRSYDTFVVPRPKRRGVLQVMGDWSGWLILIMTAITLAVFAWRLMLAPAFAQELRPRSFYCQKSTDPRVPLKYANPCPEWPEVRTEPRTYPPTGRPEWTPVPTEPAIGHRGGTPRVARDPDACAVPGDGRWLQDDGETISDKPPASFYRNCSHREGTRP